MFFKTFQWVIVFFNGTANWLLKTFFRIEPAVPGRVEWRDPVTIRLRPTATLSPGTRYTVTLANSFRAMDGSALAEQYRFTFRAQGPRLLTGSPVNEQEHAQHGRHYGRG